MNSIFDPPSEDEWKIESQLSLVKKIAFVNMIWYVINGMKSNNIFISYCHINHYHSPTHRNMPPPPSCCEGSPLSSLMPLQPPSQTVQNRSWSYCWESAPLSRFRSPLFPACTRCRARIWACTWWTQSVPHRPVTELLGELLLVFRCLQYRSRSFA